MIIKKIKTYVKLILPAGKASSLPPVGPALGQYGINISAFCKEYNLRTIENLDDIIPVKITIYEDKSYSFILKSSPTSILLKKILNIKKGSNCSNKNIVGEITIEKLEEIALLKKKDLNTDNLQKAVAIIMGTAKNMGIKII
jgi:large subunit ribosomal protein L11